MLLIVILPIILPVACVLCAIELAYEGYSGREITWRRDMGRYGNPDKRPRQRRRKGCKQALKKEAPTPLPAKRKRTLSPLPYAVVTSLQTPQRTSMQEEAAFCTRVPLEIRDMIYAHLLTSDQTVFHIYRRADRRLGQYRCDPNHFGCFEEAQARKIEQNRVWYYDDEPFYTASGALRSTAKFKNRARDLLPLLQTCRRV